MTVPRDVPIIFSAPMVKALLAGRKTMTRRLVTSPMRRVNPGDHLWVRESLTRKGADIATWRYMADDEPFQRDILPIGARPAFLGWCRSIARESIPSIHMPRFISRLTLVVTAVKVEPLQNISEDDAKAEGWERHPEISSDPDVHRDAARDWFSDLWEGLHGVESWRSNPDVVALSFKVIKENIDRIAA